MDERTENVLREIVTIVGRAFETGRTMLSADAEREIAEVLERVSDPTGSRLGDVKVLAAEAYALEYPLHGRDVAHALMGSGLLTHAEFVDLVRKYDPDVADAILQATQQAVPTAEAYDAMPF